MKLFERLGKLNPTEKIAVYAVIIVVYTLILVIFKQGAFNLGLTGSIGSYANFVHHSRWGALMALVGSYLVLKKPQHKELGLLMIVIGLFLVIHHLATEQCFALLTSEGNPVGGLC